MEALARNHRVHFGAFEVDLRSGELYKNGIRLKLQKQPFQVLALLLEHPGDVVKREELRQKLWPADTFVDFDTGLNSAIKKLRDALNDKAEAPRYVETLPQWGYRLIVPVEHAEPDHRSHVQVPLNPTNGPQITEPTVLSSQAERAEIVPLEGGQEARGTIVAVLDPSRRPTELKPPFLPRRKAALAAAVLVVLATCSWWLFRQGPGAYTIAVLPFENLSSEPGTDYFSDGLTDEIISNLSVIDGLQVKSRTSSFFFKDKPRNIHEVGAQLGVTLLVEGSVLRSGDKLRINAQLVRVSDDVPLWSNHFDRELKDVFAIQDDISRSIVNGLRLKLGRGQRRYNTNLEAYDLYLKAQTLTRNPPPPPDGPHQLLAGISLFEQVIAMDPSFAPAYAGLATTYGQLSITPRSFSPDEAYAKMRVAAEKALQLDPLLAEAYASVGLVYSRDRNWQDAERAFRRSIELNANLSESRRDYAAWVLFPLGRMDEAVRELRKAADLDPLSTAPRDFLDIVLVSTGRYDEALDNCRRILLAHPDNSAEQICGRALLQKGRLNEATAIFEKQDEAGTGSPGFLGYAYAKAGRRADAERVAARYPAWPWVHVFVYAGLDDKDRTFKALDEMAAMHDPRVGVYLTYPELALLRGDRRLTEFRQRLRVPLTP